MGRGNPVVTNDSEFTISLHFYAVFTATGTTKYSTQFNITYTG